VGAAKMRTGFDQEEGDCPHRALAEAGFDGHSGVGAAGYIVAHHNKQKGQGMRWYYHDGSKQTGPVKEDALIGLIESGVLNGGNQVWKEGTKAWVQIASSELRDHVPLVPPPLHCLPPPIPNASTIARIPVGIIRDRSEVGSAINGCKPLRGDPLRKCIKCGGDVSVIAELCPLCLAALTPLRSDEKVKGHQVALAVAGGALAVTSAIGMVAAIGGALEMGGIMLGRKSFTSKMKEIKAIDCFPFEAKDNAGLVGITQSAFVFFRQSSVVALKVNEVRRVDVVGARIDDEATKKRMFGGERITVLIDGVDGSIKAKMVYTEKPARENAVGVVQRINHYAKGKR
jgi:hypothetical protein